MSSSPVYATIATAPNAVRTLRTGLIIAAVWNLSLGASAYIANPDWLYWIGRNFYGVLFTMEPTTQNIFRILGAFMIGEGLLCASAARHPEKHIPVAHGFIVILFLRALQTLVYRDDLRAHFQMQEPYLWGQAILYASYGALMLWALVTYYRNRA